MYYLEDNKWKRHASIYHTDPETIRQDTKYHKVFIGEKYFFFGETAIEIDPHFNALIHKRHGVKCKHNVKLVEEFIHWLSSSYKNGILGNPTNPDKEPNCN
jgi:hypothetical protein